MLGKLKAMVKKASVAEPSEGGTIMGPSLRRMSHFSFGRRPSMASRGSISGTSYTKPPGPKIRYENTYRITPKDGEKFKDTKAKQILKDVVISYVGKEKYDPAMCKKLAPVMCDVIQEKLKELHYPRYKYVVQVLMGQDANQCLRSTSRCLWNVNTDDFAEFHFSVNDLFVSATVYAVFLE